MTTPSSFRLRLAGSFCLVIVSICFINLAVKLDAVSLADLTGLGLSLVFGSILALLLAWLAERDHALSIRRIKAAITDLAEGRLDISVPCLGGKDDIGKLAQAVERWRQQALICRSEMVELAAACARQDDKNQKIENLLIEFDDLTSSAVTEIAESVAALEASASSMALVADFQAGRASAISDISCKASKEVLGLTFAAEELADPMEDGALEKEEPEKSAARIIERQIQAVQSVLSHAEKTSREVEIIFQGAGEMLNIARQTGSVAQNLSDGAATLSDRSSQLLKSLQGLLQKVSALSAGTSGEFYPWRDGYLTGNGLIDRDHRVLAAYLNDLHTAMHKGMGNEAVENILAGLVHFAKDHFSREMRLTSS
ncbi:MAG: HAMP domain-containing protein, partial [Rhodospirillales bacterium]